MLSKIMNYKTLEKYNDHYIRFTTINRWNFNTKYNFNTPFGIYAYKIDKLESTIETYASNYKYAHILKFNGNKLDLSNYNKESFEKDSIKLNVDDSLINKAISTSCYDCYSGYIWNLTRLIANKNPFKWASILKNIGYDYVIDNAGIIHENEKVQAVCLIDKHTCSITCELIETLENKNLFKDIKTYIKTKNKIPYQLLLENIKNEDPVIRRWVVRNINKNLLYHFIDDPDITVREYLIMNIDKKYLRYLIKDDNDVGLSKMLAMRIDEEHLPLLIKDKLEFVRLCVARRIDKKYLKLLFDDESENVRQVAFFRHYNEK